MTPAKAEEIGASALAFLASSPDLLGVFMSSSGAAVDDLPAMASDTAFLGSVLDFVLMDDQWVTQFCDGIGVDYQDPMRARQLLPGGDLPHWT